MAKEIRIAVCDHYPIFREGVVHAIRQAKDMMVVDEGATADDAERFAHEHKFDVILLEAAIPNSLRIVKAILQTCRNAKVVFLAAEQDDDHADAAIRAGAHGYLMKGITGSDLIKAIRGAHHGERQISSDLAWCLLTSNRRTSPPREPLGTREQQVLDHTSKGKTNVEIAGILGLSISTIKRYKTKLFRKIGVRNRVQAVVEMGSNQSVKQKAT